MTQTNPTFVTSEFELRNTSSNYLTPDQEAQVTLTKDRVNSQLDFVAQMLGWNGPNYWDNLPSSPNQKRQLLGGTFGVYNGYVIANVEEFRNWDNTIVVDKIDFLNPNQKPNGTRVVVGESEYYVQKVTEEGDKYVVSIGDLTDDFYNQIAAGEPLQFDVPKLRPAPFYRPEIGVSGDYSFICSETKPDLTLYPAYDSQKKFPVVFPTLFAGSVYYFDKPVYLSTDVATLEPKVTPTYNADINLWYFKIPSDFNDLVGLTAYLVLANTDSQQENNSRLKVSIQNWYDPSDWNAKNVLDNFRGVWSNKGGELPFHFAFDALSLHGFNESESIHLETLEREFDFNQIVNYIYYQKITQSVLSPGNPNFGDLWWNEVSGSLQVWLPNDTGGNWVQLNYRQEPRALPSVEYSYADISAFRADLLNILPGVTVLIEDISGMEVSDNVIGVQGTLQSQGWVVMHRVSDEIYWTPDEFGYANVNAFQVDAKNLPYQVPVTLYDANGLEPANPFYQVANLSITISGDYDVILMKQYDNNTWAIYRDSILKYIAYSALYGSGLQQGQLWWDYANSVSSTRSAEMYYEAAWVNLNQNLPSAPPNPVLNLGVILFYCNGVLMQDGVSYVDDDRIVTITSDPANGKYNFTYQARTFKGKVELPTITISDNLTTTYQADITELTFSGITYYMSPNVYNAETPLRLWKSQDLQIAETVDHLEQNTFINPLVADLNNGPGPDNWEKYFIRMPLEYSRSGSAWGKVSLVCKNFAYWGSSIDPEAMRCPPGKSIPAIYEELFLYAEDVPDYTYVYSEPYLYSNIAYFDGAPDFQYSSTGLFPAQDLEFDGFDEALLLDYEPLHNRQADVVSPVSEGYGDWVGQYVNVNSNVSLSGYLAEDLERNGVEPVAAPVWDASIYKFAPTCESEKSTYDVDSNHYKISYSYFVADASAAEDPFFDLSKEASWRYPVTQPRTLYCTPR